MYASLNPRVLGLDLPALELVEVAARLGFGGVDLPVRDLVESGADPAAVRARMDEVGLVGGSFPLPVEWRAADPRAYRRGLDRLPRYAEAAATLGLSRTGTWLPPDWCEPIDRAPPHRIPTPEVAHVERLAPVAGVLQAHGIRLGLEPIGVASMRRRDPGCRPFVARPGDAGLRAVLEGIEARAGTGSVGLIADAFHLHAAGEPMDSALALGVDRVVAVHLADLPADFEGGPEAIRDDDRGLPGERGLVDAAGLLRLLAEAGYRGPAIAEPMGTCRSLAGLTAEGRAAAALRSLRRAWPARRPFRAGGR